MYKNKNVSSDLTTLNRILNSTHFVCVYTYHQSVKQQLSALGICNITYKQLMEKCVCSLTNRKCMMHLCNGCPGDIGVKEFIKAIEHLVDIKEVKYKQWVTVDRCTLMEKTKNFEDFSTSVSERVYKLTRHHYISKSQEIFLQNLKSNLLVNEIIILLDFSENFSFIIQDEAQSFHWKNSQYTVLPFVVYHRNSDDEEITHKSFCFLCPDTKHNTSMVYTFISILVPEIKCFIPELSKIYCFSDGCAG